MLKNEMTCSSCIYGEPVGSLGSVRCIRYPEGVMKQSEEHCGEGEWYDEKCKYNVIWGEWELDKSFHEKNQQKRRFQC